MQFIFLTIILLIPSFRAHKLIAKEVYKRNIPMKENIESLNYFLTISSILFFFTSIYCFSEAIEETSTMYFLLPFICWFINYRVLVSAINNKKK